MSRLFDYDPVSGAVETFHYDAETDNWTIQRRADVQPAIDRNKALANHWDGRIGRNLRHVASIPEDVVLLWRQMYGIDAQSKRDWPMVKRLLNSNEYLDIRCSKYRVL
jgi:hypothetical protein